MTSPTGSVQRVAGFTLIEVLVAVAILAVGAALILPALGTVARVVTVADAQLYGYGVAVSKMAEVAIARRTTPEAGERQQGVVWRGRDAFTWETVPGSVPDDPTLEAVTLTVGWRHGRSTYARQFSTVLRRPQEPAP